jgi:hypothetical protein
VVFYEDMVREPGNAIQRMADYLRVRIEGQSRDRALVTNKTDFLGRGSGADRGALLGEWRTVLSPRQIERGRAILRAFGLEQLYGDTGLPAPDFGRSSAFSDGILGHDR